MIKANELRIGNWITLFDINKPERVSVIANEVIQVYSGNGNIFKTMNIEPIPLTPEILEKAGFKNKSQTTDLAFELDSFLLAEQRKKLYPCVWGESGPESYGKEIQYVHQLQNLYFVLTGEELNINL